MNLNWHLTGQLGASCKFIMPRLLHASTNTLEMHRRAHRVRLHRFQIKRAGSPQDGSQSQMLATVSRRAPPAARRKESRGKTFGGPCQASVAARSGVLFFILHH